jgi:hypothetical protein
MKMGFILGDRLLAIERIVDVDQQMMMAAILKIITGVRHAHVTKAKAAPKRAPYSLAVPRSDEVELHILRRRLSLSASGVRK